MFSNAIEENIAKSRYYSCLFAKLRLSSTYIFHLNKCADNGNLMILHVKSVKFNGIAEISPLCQAGILKDERKGLGKSDK